jgi:hypothetical protein
MGADTPLEVVGQESDIAAALDAVRRTVRADRRRLKRSAIGRSASHVFAGLLAAAITVGLLSTQPARWWIAVGVAVLFLISLLGMPRVQRLPPLVVEIATVVGAVASVVAILVTIFHWEMPKTAAKTPTSGTARAAR